MGARKAFCMILAALAVSGCASTPFIEAAQPQAIRTAERRAQFEWNCPAATAQIVSQQMMTPPVEYKRFVPPDRAEYTIGVAGCGQRQTYLVVCTDGFGSCVTVAARPS